MTNGQMLKNEERKKENNVKETGVRKPELFFFYGLKLLVYCFKHTVQFLKVIIKNVPL